MFTKVTSFSLTFLGALCGGGGFPVAEKVFLSLEIGARLEWQRTGGLLRTDTDECSCNHDGLSLLVYAVSYLLVFAVLCAAICCLYCSKQPIEEESCVYCHAYELKQLLKSPHMRKEGSGEDDVLNC